ncbi:hypothetical protein [Sphingobium estronivorans]|uniref:hypothetical protein n=1 Tax=Sphingobium estronivorans TaxID=1577690 RepID=UPI00123981F0|nr:hypothetical protein [Sphingobium estronivorans]
MRFIILLGLAALTACGSVERKEDPASLPADNSNDDMMALPTEPDRNVARETPAPSDVSMPAFAPQYPGSTIKAAINANAGSDVTHEVRLATKDDAGAIFEFYRGHFTAAGLRKTSEFQSGGTGMMSAVGKGRKASIAITREQDHNIIIVTFSGD